MPKQIAMKQFVMFLLLLLPLGMNAQVNDIYYVPKKKVKNAPKNNEGTQQSLQTTQERFTSSTGGGTGIVSERDEDEYNRRYTYSADAESDEPGYDEAAVYDEQNDVEYLYSSRIVRFHSPRMVVTSSPWYWDVVYTSGADNWIVCDDGVYWDVYPSYVYSSWYRPTWSFGWSYGGWNFCYNDWWWNDWAFHPHHHMGGWWHGHYHHHHHNHFAPHPGHGGGHHFGHAGNPGRAFRNGTRVASRGSGNSGTMVQRDDNKRGQGTAVRRGDNNRRTGGNAAVNGNSGNGVRRGDAGQNKRGSSLSGSSDKDRRGNSYDRPSSTRKSSSRSEGVRNSGSSERRGSSVSGGSSSRGGFGSGSRVGGGGSRGGRR